MEGMNTFVEMLTSTGNVTVCVLGIAIFFLYRLVNRYNDESKELRDELMDNLRKNTDTLAKNTEAYVKLSDVLDSYNSTVQSMDIKLDTVISELKVNNAKTDTVLNSVSKQ